LIKGATSNPNHADYIMKNQKLFSIEQKLNILTKYNKNRWEIPNDFIQFTSQEFEAFQPNHFSQII
jgi:hypothetical protein